MKRRITRLNSMFVLLLGVYILLAFSSNPPNGYTGAPGEQTCQSCHSNMNPGIGGNVQIIGLPADIQPNSIHSVTIRVTATAGSPVRSGVELTTLNGNNQNAGTIIATGAFLTQSSGGGRTYVKHSNAQPFNTNVTDFTFTWQAPSGPSGDVITMYAAAVLGNGGNGNGLDRVVTTSQSGTMAMGAPALSVSIGNVSHVTCFNGDDGAAQATGSGGTPPYSYSWSTGFMGDFPMNLDEGIYTVTCTDAANMTATAMVTINQPTEIVVSTVSVSSIDCDNPNGSATITATGGNPGYFYDWASGENGPTATLLVAGNNFVTVTDGNNCEKLYNVFIPSSTTPPMADAGTGGMITCSNPTFTLDGTNSSTGPSISYQWTTNDGNIVSGGNTLNPEVNQAGTYTLEVTNQNNGCTASSDVVVTSNFATPQADAGMDETIPCLNPLADLDGSNSNGSGTLQYLWTTADGNIITSPIQAQIQVDQAGTYILEVIQSSNGCSDFDTVLVVAPPSPEISLSQIDTPSCFNATDGAIQIMVAGGTGSYSYVWSNGSSFQNLNNIGAATYSLLVNDNLGCSDSISITLPQPDSISLTFQVTPISEVGNNDAAIQASVGGGTPGYTYNWSNGGSASLIENLGPGTYTLSVTDQNNCLKVDSVQVPAINCADLDISTSVANAYNCPGANVGIISLDNILGGTAPYSVLWSNGSQDQIIENLGPGLYNVLVTDSLGCMIRDTFEIIEEDTIAPQAIARNIDVFLDQNGNATFAIADINNGSNDNCGVDSIWISKDAFDCSNLGSNTIQLYVMDGNLNLDSATAEVNVLDTIAPIIVCPDNVVSRNCLAVDYAAPTISDNCSQNLLPSLTSGLPSGSMFPEGTTMVSFTVSDDSNNSASCSFEVEVINDLMIDSFTTSFSCDSFLSLNVVASGGTSPYMYTWTSGQQGQDISINGADTLLVTDANGCTIEEVFLFNSPELLSIELDSTTKANNQAMNGAAFISFTGGTAPFEFEWIDEDGNLVSTEEDLTGVDAGTYDLVITDSNGCTSTITVVIDRLVGLNGVLDEGSYSLYPNPGSGQLYLKILQTGINSVKLSLIEPGGKLIWRSENPGGTSLELDFTRFEKGLYWLKIETEKGTAFEKVIFQ